MTEEERWKRADALFDAALDLDDEERAAFLAEACGDDGDLLSLVNRLLFDAEEPGELESGGGMQGPLWNELADELTVPDSGAPEVGTVVGGYRIIESLGGGGMGVLVKAEDPEQGHVMALKFLSPKLLRDASAKERFRREAQAATALDHPSICTIHGIGETEDGRLYIVMPFYEGETLRQKISRGPMAIAEAVEIARQTTAGLSAAHARGILHRDVKPPNILITREGRVKLLDFGLAKMAGESTLTGTGAALGTPGYMAPEQLAGRSDAHSDVWALGVVLHEMLTGERPFNGPGLAVAHAILKDEPPSLSELRPDAPLWLVRVISRCLVKDPEMRYASAVELGRDLQLAGRDPSSAEIPTAPFQKILAQQAAAEQLGASTPTPTTIIPTPDREPSAEASAAAGSLAEKPTGKPALGKILAIFLVFAVLLLVLLLLR